MRTPHRLSPYAAALGERVHELHPRLRAYFAAVPEGSVGVGEGNFAVFGVTRRWLRPLLAPLERRGALFAGRAHGVPFRVVNRSPHVRRGGAEPVVLATAVRTVQLPGRSWSMVDSVAPLGAQVVDRIGDPWTIAARFDVDVEGGALALRSNAVWFITGRLRWRVPRCMAPVVRLRESFDDARDTQAVELTVTAPLIGRVYEYQGHFRYGIVKENHHDS